MTPSTRITYQRHWHNFSSFATHYRLPQQPASPRTVACFIANLAAASNISAIPVALSAIAFYHKASFNSDPTDSFVIQKIKAGLRKQQPADNRMPITHSILLRILHAVDVTAESSFLSSLLKAMFAAMFHAFLRIGEVTQ